MRARRRKQRTDSSDSYERIYAAVARIPRGRVATYGQIAGLSGLGQQPRLVGYALNQLTDGSPVPWHRVVNAQGRISLRSNALGYDALQRVLLEDEGVRFDGRGTIALGMFQWRPRATATVAVPAPGGTTRGTTIRRRRSPF